MGGERIAGGAGADTLDGGAGQDTLCYEDALLGVTVSLDANTATGGEAAGDSIGGFEHIIGGGGADRLTGNGAANELRAAAAPIRLPAARATTR